MASYHDEHAADKEDDPDALMRLQQEYVEELQQEFYRSMHGIKPPTARSALRDIEVVFYNPNEHTESTDCVVCQEDFKKDEQLLRLECKHIFHKKCLKEWLERHNTCPMCRHELLTDDPEYEEKKLDQKNTDRKKDNIYSMYS
jgi:DNA-directed RNA polymerase subunit RPC12/RpoP